MMFRFLAFLAAALFSAPAMAAAPAPAIYTASDGLGARGYDPVAYFTEGRPVKGSALHQLEWGGAKWRFASAQTLKTFTADPARYAPQFGGYCAWAVSQHYLAPGDPNYWKIVDGKLYLNANARAKQLWEADQPEAIKRGHANWPAVLTDNQDS
jgi:YHS domain-containing protein